MLPLNLLFSIDVAAKPSYQKTIKSYRDSLQGFDQVTAFAHVQLTKTAQSQLPDVVDFLLDNDIKPLVVTAEPVLFGSSQFRDVYTMLGNELLHQNAYTLWVNGDAEITPKDDRFGSHVANALTTLSINRDLLTVSIVPPRDFPAQGFNPIQTAPLAATIMRTRDLYLAAKISFSNQNQFGGAPFEVVFNNILQTFSDHTYRNLAINPVLVSLI